MIIDLGKIKLSKPLILAPMDGYTNIPFRIVIKQMNPDLMFTEFVNSDAIIYTNKKTMGKIQILEEERPVAIQLFGHNPENMAKAAQIVESYGPEVIDLNFGCPSPKVSGHGNGAGLLKNLPLLGEICSKVVKSVKTPVTAKTRIGWDFDTINILETGKRIEDAGVKMITLHPRTKSQKYGGNADWNYIKLLKENVSIPVVGNGDIKSPEDAKRMFSETNCDGVMIGREAVSNPWIFKQTRDYFNTGEYIHEIPFEERQELCLFHFDLSVKYLGEQRAQFEMRKLYQNYFRALPNLKRFKRLVFATTDHKEIRKHIENILNIVNDPGIDFMELEPKVRWGS
ncbi:MAG: tRNA dihydrouridine synthase DusB [Candidatus Delongbacteria bacterium]|nr:tRNA dihydrouridine synthase DusB [Candidatus Delongbacteria bacterium]